jgi:cytochrome P450
LSHPIDVVTPHGIATALSSHDLAPVDYGGRHKALADHLGIDLSATLAVINHIPICLDGKAHADARKRTANIIASGANEALTFVDNQVPEMITTLLAPGQHDVMREFVYPCVNKLISANIGTDLAMCDETLVSRIFSQTTGVAKRRRMNDELTSLHQTIASSQPKLSREDIYDRLALCILGTDALRGAIGCSMKAIFDGAPISKEFHKTGVPYIDRRVKRACPIDAVEYPIGANLRAQLQILEAEEHAGDRNRFFGYGAHVCLGRRIAIKLWEQIQRQIAASQVSVMTLRYDLRKDDVFCIPETFVIEVSDG